MQCKAKTKNGLRCKNKVNDGSNYCYLHKKSDAASMIPAAIGGAIIGNAIVPIAGAIVGGLIGAVIAGVVSTKDGDNE